MKDTLKKINEMIAGCQPSDYDSVAYNKYLRDLTRISDSVIDGTVAVRKTIEAEAKDPELRAKLLSII